MDLFILLGWLVYGVLVGLVSKSIYKGRVPAGFLPTLLVGVFGSFIGGFINFFLTGNGNPFQPSGVVLGILGGVVACFIYSKAND
jgi:uncharacterized membrane protein YeaQ/YmgE (transglycosylase-associated protein family)